MYIINLPAVDDYGVQELFRTLPAYPARSMVIVEDIDAAGIEKRDNTANEEKDGGQKRIMLATLLATFDGLRGHASHVLIVTTNAKPKLDTALTRPGRIDRQFEFGNPDSATIAAYFSFFFDKCASRNSSDLTLDHLAVEFSGAVSHLTLSPAKLQEYFMRCKDPAIAIKNVATLAQMV
ncbi:Mitochondrial chaperone BCS1 [Penicillium rolfsii]|nr:Mitochondrial chaperone BCS1 [Penicillium rolfsii]